MGLIIVPISLKEANVFVAKHHRHHAPVVGHKFSVAVADDMLLGRDDCTGICGVAIVGRPVARGNDGTRNACSTLYGAAWRATRALGYARLITYTLPDEGGASLRGAGWHLVGARGGGNWNTPARPRIDTAAHLRGQKLLWEVT